MPIAITDDIVINIATMIVPPLRNGVIMAPATNLLTALHWHRDKKVTVANCTLQPVSRFLKRRFWFTLLDIAGDGRLVKERERHIDVVAVVIHLKEEQNKLLC